MRHFIDLSKVYEHEHEKYLKKNGRKLKDIMALFCTNVSLFTHSNTKGKLYLKMLSKGTI